MNRQRIPQRITRAAYGPKARPRRAATRTATRCKQSDYRRQAATLEANR